MQTFKLSNFLKSGAILSWSNSWYLFQGPFETVSSVKKQPYDFAVQHFFDHELRHLKAAQKTVMTQSEFCSFLGSNPQRPDPVLWSGPNQAEYAKSFQVHYEMIKNRELNKAVPFVFDRSGAQPDKNRIRFFLDSLSQFQHPLIPYGFWNEKEGFVGLTPEVLFHKKADIIESMALAGTEKKVGAPPSLQDDKKIQREHQLVVDELQKRWSEWGSVQQNPRAVLELPTLFHLITRFRVELKSSVSAEDITRLLHPTSAVGTSPFDKWRVLESLPGQKERGFYGSPVLFQLSSEEQVALVALRQVQWDKNGMRLGAGGGILLESRVDSEWDEVLAKIESVKKWLKT